MLPQLEAVREGFYQVMPKDVLSKFTELELELLLHGMPFIDVEVSGHGCC
jgi:E3 ubiquitin-protein ligase HUWE1